MNSPSGCLETMFCSFKVSFTIAAIVFAWSVTDVIFFIWEVLYESLFLVYDLTTGNVQLRHVTEDGRPVKRPSKQYQNVELLR